MGARAANIDVALQEEDEVSSHRLGILGDLTGVFQEWNGLYETRLAREVVEDVDELSIQILDSHPQGYTWKL